MDQKLIGLIIGVVLGLNAFLFGAYHALEFIKDKTATQADDNAYAFLGKILGYLQKVIEVIGPVSTEKK